MFRNLNGGNGAAVRLGGGATAPPAKLTSTVGFEQCIFEDSLEVMPARGVLHVSRGTAARFAGCEFRRNRVVAGADVSAEAAPPPVYAQPRVRVAVAPGGGVQPWVARSQALARAPADFKDASSVTFASLLAVRAPPATVDSICAMRRARGPSSTPGSPSVQEHDCLSNKVADPQSPQAAQPCPEFVAPPPPALEPAAAPVAAAAEAEAAPPPSGRADAVPESARLGATPLQQQPRSGRDTALSRRSMWTVIAAAIVASAVIAVLLLLLIKHRRKARGRDWDARHVRSRPP